MARLTQRPPQAEIDAAVGELAARFGNRLVTSQAVREQHGHNLSWTPNQPPDAVVFAQSTEDVADAVKICAGHGVPVIALGTNTSLEGHTNAPYGGVSIDVSQMNEILEVHAEDLDVV
ncbi:MAG: FAD-binding protein, partial [Rhodoblastus sp.]|nr:FAD-binding protein [Rhodoblastus sp.]